ncbi:hypothetical protein ZWY2020_052789 [Hordeum vulgare]|nr:hypothetical protein ZWY2020_052789 [Hordeum vulgare]
MDSGECSNSNPSASSPAAAGVWAKLVSADSAYPEVAVAEDDAVVCSLVAPAAGRGARVVQNLQDLDAALEQHTYSITERCIQQSGKTLQAVISEWIAKFDNKELDRSRLQLSNVEAITSSTYLCNHCYNKFVDFLLYWFRVSTPRNLLPADAADRDSCWYGFMCRPSTIDRTMPRN